MPVLKTDWEEIGISNDFLFGKIMRDPRLCRKLLERILPDLKIGRIEYPQLQKTIREDVDARSVRLDVYVRDGKGTVYNIEMQAVDTRELPKRSRYYQSMIDLQLIDRNVSYRKLGRSYVIFICLTDIFGAGRHIYTFENRCREENGLALGDEAVKVFLNASGKKDDVSAELRAFLDYVAGKPSEDGFVKELETAVAEAKQNREWRHEYMTLLMRDQENLERGREIGLKQGVKQGKIAGAISMCRDLGLPEDEILRRLMEKFGLPEEEAMKYMRSSNL